MDNPHKRVFECVALVELDDVSRAPRYVALVEIDDEPRRFELVGYFVARAWSAVVAHLREKDERRPVLVLNERDWHVSKFDVDGPGALAGGPEEVHEELAFPSRTRRSTHVR